MRVDPYSLSTVDEVCETVTLTDPNQPGVEIECTFAALDAVSYHKAEDLTMEYIAKYMGPNALPFPGAQVTLSRALIQTACNAVIMQKGKDEDKYSVEEWIVLSHRMPKAWSHLVWFLTDLTNRGPLGKVASVSEDTTGASSESR